MKNLLTFYASCGHTTVEEVSEGQWTRMAGMSSEELTKRHPLGLQVQEAYSVECSDGSARMVYIYPIRYFDCRDCVKVWEDAPYDSM